MGQNNEQNEFDKLSQPEQRAALVWAMAAKLEEAPEQLAELEQIAALENSPDKTRDKFVEIAQEFFPLFQGLADEAKTNHANDQQRERMISITKSHPSEDLPWVMVLAHRGQQKALFCLPDPELIEKNNSVWSRNSQPAGRATLTHREDLIDVSFSLMGSKKAGNQAFVDFAQAIVLASEIITDTNAPEEIDLRNDTQLELDLRDSV